METQPVVVSDPLSSSFVSTSANSSPDPSEGVIKPLKYTDDKTVDADPRETIRRDNSSLLRSSATNLSPTDGLRRRGTSEGGLSPNNEANEIARRGSIGAGLNFPKAFAPTVVLDGSKLILRLIKNNSFVIDNPCKVLLATPQIRLERPVAWQTNGTCTEAENTIVVDCGLLGHHFVPIPLGHYGTIYTRDGTVHVTVGSSIRRAKVHSRNLPYRTCNKFHCVSVLESETPEEQAASSVAGWFMERQNTNHALASVDPEQAVKLIKQMTSDPRSGVVYFRADDSILRYRLGHDEKIELHSGRVVAWTVAVRFEQTNYCCCRFVTAVHGEGTVWIQNSRGGSVTSPGI